MKRRRLNRKKTMETTATAAAMSVVFCSHSMLGFEKAQWNSASPSISGFENRWRSQGHCGALAIWYWGKN